jgi:peptidoglycan/xylan/chitin deacetylase (PgdA/CDA1 family)
MNNETKLKIGLGIALAICVAGISYVLYNFYKDVKEADLVVEMTDQSERYTAKEDIDKALAALKEGVTPAAVVTHGPSGSQVALVLDGMPDRPSVDRIIKVLKQNDASASFFVEGQNAADEEEAIHHMTDAGLGVENFTFLGMAHADVLSDEELAEQFCRTQAVIRELTGTSPTYARAPQTTYTTRFLKVLKACGIDYAVEATAVIRLKSIHNEADAAAAVASLQPGSILAIETGTPVSATEDKPKTSEDPGAAHDRKPTVKDSQAAPSNSSEPGMAEKIGFILKALKQKGLTPVHL